MDDHGFYLAEIDSRRGLVPANFLAEDMDHYKLYRHENNAMEKQGTRFNQ